MTKKNLFLNLSKFSSQIAIINNDLQQFTYANLINDIRRFKFFFKETYALFFYLLIIIKA